MITPAFRRALSVVVCVVAAAAVLAGCASAMQPYVYIPDEFDRTKPDFNKLPKDRSQVMICYNKYKTTPAQLQKMAEDECGRYHKKAVFWKQESRLCPLMAPVSAYFRCLKPENNAEAP